MEKKKMSLVKILVLMLILIILIFVFITLRNFIIIANLNSTVSKQIANTNVAVKNDNETNYIESYRKGDITKYVVHRKNDTSTTLTQITTPTKRLLYTDNNGTKRMYMYPGDGENEFFNENQNIIPNYARTVTWFEKLLMSMTTRITSQNLDGKEYYVLSGFGNPNYIYDENTISLEIYIEKETGLTQKVVESIKKDKDIVQKLITYEYEFNHVTDEDVAELDSSEYVLEE